MTTEHIQFEHQSSAREEGAKTAMAGAAIAAVCGIIPVLTWYQGVLSIGAIIWSVALGLLAAAGLVLLFGGLMRVIVGGQWHITISSNALTWSPPPLAEHPFSYAPDDARLEKRIREKPRQDGSIKEKIRYVLVGNDGREHWINKQSGIDVESFVAAAQRVGVALTEVRQRRQSR